MAHQKCVIVWFDYDATDETLANFQRDIVNADTAEYIDYSIMGYSDGFGRVVSRDDTVHSMVETPTVRRDGPETDKGGLIGQGDY